MFLLARAFSFPVVLFTIARAQRRRSEDHREIKRGERERKGIETTTHRAREKDRETREESLSTDDEMRERERSGRKEKEEKRRDFTFLIFAPRARLMNIYISRVRFAL